MHLLFDLDGTLTDSRDGIARCLQYALEDLGRPVPAGENLTQYVGPPLAGAFAALLGTDETDVVERAIAAYRRRYERIGILENVVYPGVADALTELANAGYVLSVVTAKPHVYARRILDHFALTDSFSSVHGPELGDRRYSKESLIRAACSSARVPPNQAVMIGDRAEDVIGAKRNGLAAVAVTWGYGTRDELEAAHPDDLVDSIGQLVRCLNARYRPFSRRP